MWKRAKFLREDIEMVWIAAGYIFSAVAFYGYIVATAQLEPSTRRKPRKV